MFIGHLAVGLAAKRAAPSVSLGTLFAAGMALDLLWPILILTGVEHVRITPGITAATPLDLYDYPWSHSLVFSLLWSALAGAAHYAWRRSGRAAVIVGALVFSHWLLDFVTHRPDLPILPSGPYVGLGLWHSLPGTIIVELALFGAALGLYVKSTRPLDRRGSYTLGALAVFLVVMYFAALLGPPPPSVTAIGISANLAWLLVLWGGWIDRHRALTSPA